MFKAGVAFLVIIGLVILWSLIVTVMGIFGLSGGIWDWLRYYINWDWLGKYQAFVAGSIGAFLLFWAAGVATFQLRAARRTSYADLLERLYEEWDSERYIKSREALFELAPLDMEQSEQSHKVAEKMKTATKEDYFLLTRPLDFFEVLAFLIRKNYIPLEDATRTFGEAMVAYYKMFEDCINDMRQVTGNENAYKELEEVVKELHK